METIRTKGFTAKDDFNTSSSMPLKEIVGETIEVIDVCVKEKLDGQTIGYIKTTDKMYATISETVIEQIISLAELVPATVTVVERESNQKRKYLLLELN